MRHIFSRIHLAAHYPSVLRQWDQWLNGSEAVIKSGTRISKIMDSFLLSSGFNKSDPYRITVDEMGGYEVYQEEGMDLNENDENYSIVIEIID